MWLTWQGLQIKFAGNDIIGNKRAKRAGSDAVHNYGIIEIPLSVQPPNLD